MKIRPLFSLRRALRALLRRVTGRRPDGYAQQDGPVTLTPVCWTARCPHPPRYMVDDSPDGIATAFCGYCMGLEEASHG